MGHYAPITKVLIGRLIRQSLRWRERHRRNQQSQKSFHGLVVAAMGLGLPQETAFCQKAPLRGRLIDSKLSWIHQRPRTGCLTGSGASAV